jgi:hypothetical protein
MFLNAPVPVKGLSFVNRSPSVLAAEMAHLLLLPMTATVRMGTGTEYSGTWDLDSQIIGHYEFLKGPAMSMGKLTFHFSSPTVFDSSWAVTAIVDASGDQEALALLELAYVNANGQTSDYSITMKPDL